MLKETLRLYRANALLFIGIVALLNVPLQLVTLVLNLTAPRIPPVAVSVLLNLPATQGSTVTLVHPLTAAYLVAVADLGTRAVVGVLLSLVAGTLTTAALAVAGTRVRAGQAVSIMDAYRAVRERLGALTIAFLWAAVRLFVLFLLCPTVIGLVLFIYFLVAWALIPQAVMVEGRSGGAASGRSRRLVKGQWQRASNLFVAVIALTLVFIGVPSIILGALLAHPLGVPMPLVQGIAGILIGLFIQPLAAAATTTLYVDLTTRQKDRAVRVAAGGDSARPLPG